MHSQKSKPGTTNAIGGRIKEARRKCKPPVSQEDLAARLAVAGVYIDRSAISRMEKNDRFIRDYEIIAIAKALKIPISTLFGKE